ncbi:Protein of unknown function DUF604 [Dillenia turbinata]|uniref:Uncharacterized protein n=1 Tax=Dillenia turbinata TaxID=194707 RepID=A0AAN8UPN7_9MAGN
MKLGQLDLSEDIFGLLASHPLRPLVSFHHADHANPIFPNMCWFNRRIYDANNRRKQGIFKRKNRIFLQQILDHISNNMTAYKAFEQLFKAVNLDSSRILQQTVCYNRWFMWTVSVSWGYAVQIYGYHLYLPDVLPEQSTFTPWDKKRDDPLSSFYTFNIRELHVDKCRRPTIFFMVTVSSSRDKIKSIYKRNLSEVCVPNRDSLWRLQEIRVFFKEAPRRHCCDVLNSSAGAVMEIALRECGEDELIYMH